MISGSGMGPLRWAVALPQNYPQLSGILLARNWIWAQQPHPWDLGFQPPDLKYNPWDRPSWGLKFNPWDLQFERWED